MCTPARSPSLEELLKREIAQRGPLPFSRFMELALYDEKNGYYASGRAVIGKKGDYYTNVSVGKIFGKILCGQFSEVWKTMGKPASFVIAEQGGNNGQFAADVLEHARAHDEEFFAHITYRLIEPLPHLRKKQNDLLSPFIRKVEWFDNLVVMPEMEGIFFANELVDAFPVELVQWDGRRWMERRVAWKNEAFQFENAPIENAALTGRLEKIPAPATEIYHTEVNLESDAWIAGLAHKLKRGCTLICDYGYPRNLYYSAERTEGTLSCYAAHRRSHDALIFPGEKDITSHVDFTTLAESATNCGFDVMGFSDQYRFLTGASENFLKKVEENPLDAENLRLLRTLRTLLHPEIMGKSFHYLGLSKGVDLSLSGFKHSSKGIENLEMNRQGPNAYLSHGDNLYIH